jgi:serine protease AprX
MRGRLALAVVCLAAASTAPSSADGDAFVHPVVWRDFDDRDQAVVWVFLRDKDIADVDRALADLAATYDGRAIARRELRRKRPGLFDITDLPVSPRYERAIGDIVDRVRARSRWLNAISVEATREQIEQLAQLPFVDRIQPVRRGAIDHVSTRDREAGDADGSFYGLSEAQFDTINLPPVHDAGFTGNGVVIGVLDTGFLRTHEAFNQPGHVLSVIAEYDFINDDPNTAPETGDDPNQHIHGTLILGVMGGYKPGTFVGAAYDASFILCKTEDVTDEYPAEEDYYVAGLEFIEANGGDVATSSLGYIDWYTQEDLDGMTAVTTIGVNIATDNGVHCCTAAGNSGHDGDPSSSHLIAPADAFDVFTVGAVNIFGEEAGFSSDGPTADGRVKPEILAVGDAAATIAAWDDTGYTDAAGTSMSTPHIAAVVACLVEAGPSWTVEQMRDAITLTGTDYVANGQTDPLFIRGYGIADAFAALEAGPDSDVTLTNLSMLTGTIISGGLADLDVSDDVHLRTRSGFGQSFIDLHKTEFLVDALAPLGDHATLDLAIESRLNQPSGTARIRMFDHGAGAFVTVAQYAINNTDALFNLADLDASRYVAADGSIRAELRHVVFVPIFAFRFDSFFDLIRFAVD